MTDEIEFQKNSKPETLYVYPAKNGSGAYARLLCENEELIDEIEVTVRSRLILSVFYVNGMRDFNRLMLTKITFHERYDWQKDGEIVLNRFQLAHLKRFASFLSNFDFLDVNKSKISLKGFNIDGLNAIMETEKSADLLKQLANNPELSEDVFALAHKKAALEDFRQLLTEYESFKSTYVGQHDDLKAQGEENIWQYFFEQNSWIFGHGLNYIFLDKVGKKLESVTTGMAHDASGKRVDALMRTRAAISQFVLIEIKTPSAPLLKPKEYRAGCWAVSNDVSDAVTQIQKTSFDFTKHEYRKVQVKERDGRITGEEIFMIQPKSYLVIGNLAELKGYDDKFVCFHLYRTSLNTPEILTYDELYERAKCIVETISGKNTPQEENSAGAFEDKVPF